MCYAIIKNKSIVFDDSNSPDFYIDENKKGDSIYIVNNHLNNKKNCF